MRFVVSTAFSPAEHLCALAKAAEEAGFGAVAVSDHVVHPRRIRTPYPYTPDGRPRWEPFTPWPDPLISVGAMAAVTLRIRFLTSVFVLPMRNVFLAAKAVATAACLSGGRLLLGIGAGWMKEEFDLVGQPFRRRGRRMDEMIDVLRKLWGGGWVEHHGEFYDFEPLEMSPTPPAPVPIFAGGASDAVLRRAATRCDGWISDLHTTDQLREMIGRLRRYRQEAGRGPEPLEVFASCIDAVDVDAYRRLGDLGVTHLQTMPWLFYGGAAASLQDKIDGIHRFGDEVIAEIDS